MRGKDINFASITQKILNLQSPGPGLSCHMQCLPIPAALTAGPLQEMIADSIILNDTFRFEAGGALDGMTVVFHKSMDEYDGKSMLIYYVKDIKKIIKNPTSVGVQICRELLDKLSGMYGEDNVKVTYA